MDEPAFVAAMSAELPRLQRLARRVACGTTDPDDLVEDTLERAWRSRDRFRADSTAPTWLHRILVNRAIDLCRRAGQIAVPASTASMTSACSISRSPKRAR